MDGKNRRLDSALVTSDSLFVYLPVLTLRITVYYTTREREINGKRKSSTMSGVSGFCERT